MSFQKSLFYSKLNFPILLINKQRITSLKKKLKIEKHLLEMLSRKDIKNILYIYIFIYLSPHIYLVNKKKLQYIKYIYTIQMVVNSIE